MSVVIDENAGFCFGVVKAIAAAEQQLQSAHQLYCLGDIVHNNKEVQRLRDMGLQVIDHGRLESLSGATVLIRAHGEPPRTYEEARRRGVRLIDATCPIVLALQKKVKEGYEMMHAIGGQVVIFGKQGHAEVIGLNGQTDNTAIIVSSPEAVEAIDFRRPIRLYSQTTKGREEYAQLIHNIEQRIAESGVQQADFVAYNTICSRVANRVAQLEQFAKSVEMVLFVSGANSSNGHYLYECCRRVQPNTKMIGSANELDAAMVRGAQHIGITGATSTPRWLMEEVKTAVEKLCCEPH